LGPFFLFGSKGFSEPVLQALNALCLGYSAGKDGPLVTYDMSDPAEPLTKEKIRVNPAIS